MFYYQDLNERNSDIGNELYSTIVQIRNQIRMIQTEQKNLEQEINNLDKLADTSIINQFYKAGELLATVREHNEIAQMICSFNQYLHPTADEILSSDINYALLKQNYMSISFWINSICSASNPNNIIESTSKLLQKAEIKYNIIYQNYMEQI